MSKKYFFYGGERDPNNDPVIYSPPVTAHMCSMLSAIFQHISIWRERDFMRMTWQLDFFLIYCKEIGNCNYLFYFFISFFENRHPPLRAAYSVVNGDELFAGGKISVSWGLGHWQSGSSYRCYLGHFVCVNEYIKPPSVTARSPISTVHISCPAKSRETRAAGSIYRGSLSTAVMEGWKVLHYY